jgi:hypothetical protein
LSQSKTTPKALGSGLLESEKSAKFMRTFGLNVVIVGDGFFKLIFANVPVFFTLSGIGSHCAEFDHSSVG